MRRFGHPLLSPGPALPFEPQPGHCDRWLDPRLSPTLPAAGASGSGTGTARDLRPRAWRGAGWKPWGAFSRGACSEPGVCRGRERVSPFYALSWVGLILARPFSCFVLLRKNCAWLRHPSNFLARTFKIAPFRSPSGKCSESLRPLGLHSPWNSPGQNTGVRCVAFPFCRESS